MESRKMVMVNLFAGQKQRGRHGEQTCGHRREGEGMNFESSTEICTLPCVNYIASGSSYAARGAQLGAL